MNKHKSGFAAIVGRPNVGKSTLLNRLLGQKIAIVSDKSQTTRNTIKGILSEKDYQIVFLDTPGIHKPQTRLGEYMMKVQREATIGTDAVIAMLDATEFFGPTDKSMLENLKACTCPVYLVINKTDAAAREQIDALKQQVSVYDYIAKIIEVSALSGDGAEQLLEELIKIMPEGPSYFPEDLVSDFPEKFLAGEVIREKALNLLREEVPHGVGVIIEEMKERPGGKLYIRANILCERSSHKGILIGKNGTMLKQIGTQARTELEELLETSVFLELFVKVQEDWRNQSSALKQLGYDVE